MPSAPRQIARSGYYHVTLRGNGKQLLFEDDADRISFLEALAKRTREHDIGVIAWCLMDNHIHLLLDDPRGELSACVHDMAMDYARRFNTKNGHVGHVFQGRFSSTPVEGEGHLLEAIRYIHANPEKAGLAETSKYPWSSFREYLSQSPGICRKEPVLEMLGGTRGFLDFARSKEPMREPSFGRRVSDERMHDVAVAALRGLTDRRPSEVASLPKELRDAALVSLRRSRLSVRQIQRITGIGTWTIRKVTDQPRTR